MSTATRPHNDLAAKPRREALDSDEALLHDFVTSRDDLAFARIVTRHASVVMAVCRRVLGNEQDAEDAFQATFLVLARKAGSLKNAKSLPAWLHVTAHRISLRARANKARRRERSLESEIMTEDHATLQQIATEHERSTLDEEINRLPDRFRLPLFLCCLEGKTREEAARQLGWTIGSLKGRLERGRQLLRRRLLLRGISFAVAVSLVMRTPSIAHASVADSVVASTVQAGMRYAAGHSPVGYVSQNAFHLANWSLQVMSITSAKFAACVLMVVGAIMIGNQWTVDPVVANGNETATIVLQETPVVNPQTTFVSLQDKDEPEGRDRKREEDERARDQGRRESAEGRERAEQPRDGDRRREGEPRRDSDRPQETRERDGDAGRREGFRPQTDNEELLYKMIVRLQREVAELRNALRSRGSDDRRTDENRERDVRERGREERDQDRDAAPRENGRERDGDRRATSRDRDPDSTDARRTSWQNTREGKVFKAYDKNGDLSVSLEEWLAMQEGEMTDARRKLESKRFEDAEPSGDGKFGVEEFLHWFTKGRYQNSREGGRSEERGR